jgi:putative ABC transport system substrate-binding protein
MVSPEFGARDMERREFITLLGGVAAAWPLYAYAEPRLPRVGVLLYDHAVSPTELSIARELAQRGYVVGRNITYVIRAAESDASRMPLLARQLVAEKPDVIVAVTSFAAMALGNATRDIPVVMAVVGDPIALGLTSSISSPTHNVTGFTVAGRRFQLNGSKFCMKLCRHCKRPLIFGCQSSQWQHHTSRTFSGRRMCLASSWCHFR